MECDSLSGKWEELSTYLGLPANKIEAIRRDYGNTHRCWNQALLEWIKQGYPTEKYGKPSWRTLVQAIEKKDKRLSEELSQKHKCKQS